MSILFEPKFVQKEKTYSILPIDKAVCMIHAHGVLMQLSVTNRRWSLLSTDLVTVRRLMNEFALSPIIATCLAPVVADNSTRSWLQPSFDNFHDPFLMKGMHRAVSRLQQAFRNRERIRIVTDYDVDGTTSSLVLQAAFRAFGHGDLVDYHIPDRFSEGYGFSEHAAHKAVEDNIDLIVTADIGVRDHISVNAAVAGGVDVLICDHHLPPGQSVPAEAHAVLCPPQYGCTYPNPGLAACGVAFKLAQALISNHPKYKNDPQLQQRFYLSLLKIVSIGTVADMVPLSTMENRAIVSLGLQQLRQPLRSHSMGLQALLESCGLIDGWIDSSSIGFKIGPRINAAGRLKVATDVIDLFLSKDIRQARKMAQDLDLLNQERKQIQEALANKCQSIVPNPVPDFIVLWGHERDGWHRGVVGIVATKIRDMFHRSTAIVAINGGQARASVRTTDTIHAVEALDSVNDLLGRYGGHAAAAGFDVPVDKLEQLAHRLNAFAQLKLNAQARIPELEMRVQCRPQDVHLQMANSLRKLGPFGKDNPVPLFWVKNVKPTRPQLLKNTHLKFFIDGNSAIWWDAKKHFPLVKSGQLLDIAARIEVNRWKQRTSVQYMIEDMRLADP